MLRSGVVLICALALSGVQAKKAPAKAPATAPAKPAAPAAPKKEMTVPFKPGEVLDFDIGWSSYLTAGTATVTVQGKEAVLQLGRLLHRRRRAADAAAVQALHALLQGRHAGRRLHAAAAARLALRRGGQAAPDEDDDLQPGGEAREVRGPDGDARREGPRAARLHPGRALGALRAALDPDEGRRQVQHAGHRRRRRLQGADAGRSRSRAVKTALGTMNALKIVPLIAAARGRRRAASPSGFPTTRGGCRCKIEAQLPVGKFVVSLRKVTG